MVGPCIVVLLVLLIFAWAELGENGLAPMSETEKEDLVKTFAVFTQFFQKRNA